MKLAIGNDHVAIEMKQEIRAYLKTRLASYQVPAAIRFVDEIPVTPNGKVNKKYIRTIF